LNKVSNGFVATILLLCACADEPQSDPQDIQSALVQGSFFAPEGEDDAWTGIELVEAYGRGGILLCSREWEMEAIPFDVETACSGCSIVLEVVESDGGDAASTCSESLDDLGRVHRELPVLGYAPSTDGLTEAPTGSVYIQRASDDQWRQYSSAGFDGSELTYVHHLPSPADGGLIPTQGVEADPTYGQLPPGA